MMIMTTKGVPATTTNYPDQAWEMPRTSRRVGDAGGAGQAAEAPVLLLAFVAHHVARVGLALPLRARLHPSLNTHSRLD